MSDNLQDLFKSKYDLIYKTGEKKEEDPSPTDKPTLEQSIKEFQTKKPDSEKVEFEPTPKEETEASFIRLANELKDYESESNIDEDFETLKYLGNLLFTGDSKEYWLTNTDDSLGQGVWNTKGTDPTAGDIMVQKGAAEAGQPMTSSSVMENSFNLDPFAIIENYATMSGMEGSQTGLDFLASHRNLTAMLAGDPDVFTQYNPLSNFFGDFFGDQRVDIPGGQYEFGELFNKPYGMNQIISGNVDMTSANMWKDLDEYAINNPGEKGDAIKRYKKDLINALPFLESIKGQFSSDKLQYLQLEKLFSGEDTSHPAYPEIKKWQQMKQSSFQEYKLMLDQGIIDTEGNILDIK